MSSFLAWITLNKIPVAIGVSVAVVVIVVAIVLGVVLGGGGSSSSTATTTSTPSVSTSPTPNATVANFPPVVTTSATVTPTITVTPTPTVSVTVNGTAFVRGPSAGSYSPAPTVVVTYPLTNGFRTTPVVSVNTATSILMAQTATVGADTVGLTSAQLSISALNSSVGYNTAIPRMPNGNIQLGGSNYAGANISIMRSLVNGFPCIAFANSRALTRNVYGYSANIDGSSTWTYADPSPVSGTQASMAGSALWYDSAGTTLWFFPLYNTTSASLHRTDTAFSGLTSFISWTSGGSPGFVDLEAPVGGFNLDGGNPAFFANSNVNAGMNLAICSVANPTSSLTWSSFQIGTGVQSCAAQTVSIGGRIYVAAVLSTTSTLTFFLSNNVLPASNTFTLSSVITSTTSQLPGNRQFLKLFFTTINSAITPVVVFADSTSNIWYTYATTFSTTVSANVLQSLTVVWATPVIIQANSSLADAMISTTPSNLALISKVNTRLVYTLIPITNPSLKSINYLGSQTVGTNLGVGLVGTAGSVPAISFNNAANTGLFFLTSPLNEDFSEGVTINYSAFGVPV